MSPADIDSGAEFRGALARRLAEVGLVPPEHAELRLAAASTATAEPPDEHRRAA
jgi:hypothetical protein